MKIPQQITHRISTHTWPGFPATGIRRWGGVPKALSRRFRITVLAALPALFFSGATTHAKGQSSPRPRNADTLQTDAHEIIAGGIAIIGAVAAVVIIIAVNHDHHTLKGCVSSGPNGPELQTSDSKTYSLEGDSSTIKVGDMVKFHGSKTKKTKDGSGHQVFKVEQMKRDYGPCHVTSAPAAGGTP